jgi:hypothetical protein
MATVISGNIKAAPRMTKKHAAHDIQLLFAQGADVVFGQEILPADYKREFLRVALRRKFAVYNLNTEIPIALDTRRWQVTDHNRYLMHQSARSDGLRFKNPSRYVSEVLAVSKVGARFHYAFENTHTVPHAFDKRFVPYRNWRKTRWDTHFARQRAVVTNRVNQGYNVVTGGDLNRVSMTGKKYHSRQTEFVHRGYDHLFGVPVEGLRFRVQEREILTAGTYTDHPFILAQFGLVDA